MNRPLAIKKHFLFLFLLFMCLPEAISSGNESHIIVIGGDAKYPPYEFLDKENKPSGFSVELSEALAHVMGLSVEIKLGSWDKMREGLKSGGVDVLQGTSYSDERAKIFDFSPPYTLIQHSIFARKDFNAVKTLEDLKGKQVVVQNNGIMHDYLKSNAKAIIPVPTDYQADALRQVASGRYDYAIVAQLPGLYFIRELGLTNISPVGPPVAVQKYCYAARKGNTELISRISEGLAILKKTGQLGKIHRKWLGVLEPGLSIKQVLRIVGGIFLVFTLFLLGSLLWSRALKSQVALRTEELKAEIEARKKAAAELETRQKQLIQADKMASLGYLVSGIAHELNNPNGLILLNLPVLADVYRDSEMILEKYYETKGDFMVGGLNYSRMRKELPYILDETKEAAEQIRSIVEGLKDFGRQSADEIRESSSLNELFNNAHRLARKTIEKSTDKFNMKLTPNLPNIMVNPQRVEQVIVNLVINACQSLNSKDNAIFISTAFVKNDNMVVLTIKDEGEGISEKNLPHLTDPFFTTRRASGGTGLGLSVSAGIVKAQRGTMIFDSKPGRGTIVKLSFPATCAD